MEILSAPQRARLSLEGLSIGDAFGEQFFRTFERTEAMIQERKLPTPPWEFTDDTVMAFAIVEVLETYGEIRQDELAETFARNYRRDPSRGYGGMAFHILADISQGADWREVSSSAFQGSGSMGNGGAMRVAPVGAYFAGNFEKTAEQARLSAEVTHSHLEGQAGAIAIAVAAAYAASSEHASGKELLETALTYTPEGRTRNGIQRAISIPFSSPIQTAVNFLGNGSRVTAPDTVPFALWCAARHLDNFEDALWETVSGLGDRDTTCAMAGGIVALSAGREGISVEWLNSRESLDGWIR